MTLHSKFRIFTACAGAICVLMVGCAKPGTGGKASITGQIKHHDDLIPNANVYIKYGVDEQPESLSDYDDQIMADGSATYTFEELRKGKYYVYAVGYDPAIADDVVGGIPLKISKKDEVLQSNIPVTE